MDSGGGDNEGCCRDSAKKSVLYLAGVGYFYKIMTDFSWKS